MLIKTFKDKNLELEFAVDIKYWSLPLIISASKSQKYAGIGILCFFITIYW